jgi:mannose/fructose/N-acetylgalactosamine-specific phosphotransferase system component IIB
MLKKQEITIFLPVFFIVLVILFVVSCGSFEIVYAPPPKKPVERAPAQEPAKEPVPSKEVTEEAAPSEKTSEEPAPPKTAADEPAPSQKMAKTTEDLVPKDLAPKDLAPKDLAPKKTSAEHVIEGTVRIDKNNYLIYDSSSDILYRLVGLKKEEKTRLNQLKGTSISLEIRVVSTESAKAWNAQLIKIIEGSISEEKIAEVIPSEKETHEKKIQEEKIAKAEPPEEKKAEKEKTVEEEKVEEKATSEEKQPEEITIEGVLSIDKNIYYISDPESGIQYKLVGLNKEDMKRLKKMKGKNVSVDIQVVSTESEKVINAQFVRFL